MSANSRYLGSSLEAEFLPEAQWSEYDSFLEAPPQRKHVEPLFSVTPSVCSFGLVKQGCEYCAKVTIRSIKTKPTKFRLKPSQRSIAPEPYANRYHVSPAINEKVAPGMVYELEITFTANGPAEDWRDQLDIQTETGAHRVVIEAKVRAEVDFDRELCLSRRQRIPSRPSGVTLIAGVESDGRPRIYGQYHVLEKLRHGVTPSGTFDTHIVDPESGLREEDLYDISTMPFLPNSYWDVESSTLMLDTKQFDMEIDPKLTVREIKERDVARQAARDQRAVQVLYGTTAS